MKMRISDTLRLAASVIIALVAWTGAAARQWRVADVENVHVADSTRFVANPDGVLSSQAVATIDSRLRALQRQTSAEVTVVALDSIDQSTDIDAFATGLFNRWGIGKSDRDNGLLILLVKGERRVTLRTGQGTETVVPDIIAGRIIRELMAPRFREGDYDGGVIAAVDRVSELIADPSAAGDIRSSRANNQGPDSRHGSSGDSLFSLYWRLAVAAGVVMLVIVGWRIVTTRRLGDVERYRALDRMSLMALFMVFIGLGAPLPAYLLLRWKLHRLRDHKRKCPRCSAAMTRLDEESDNAYLTPAQDSEERLNSVDYDVWLCPKCGDTEIIPYVNKASSYTVCPHCHARAMSLLNTRTVAAPTTLREGQGVRTYTCRHCGNRIDKPFSIPKVVVVPPVVGRGGGFGGGGGGFGGGGSFGGGSSMGGGATGSW